MTPKTRPLAIILSMVLALAPFHADAQPSGLTRTVVGKADVSVPGREAVVARVEVAAGARAGRHTHPGDEISYVVEGEVELLVDGHAPRTLRAGESFVVPAGAVHDAHNASAGPARLVGVYIVDKGKPLASPAPPVGASDPAANSGDSRIRAARARFNDAIARQDVASIGALLAPSYHIVTGRSAQAHGRAGETENWRSTFHNDPGFRCERTPQEISMNEAWGLAQESGRWDCSYRAAGEPVKSRGVYAAKWQQDSAQGWLLQVEVFTTLACEGPDAGCRRPDPIE